MVFLLDSPDGDQGFPGELKISVKYTLTKENAVDILYAVTSDRDTPVNMTNHAYFNLGGHASGSVLDTRIQILADSFTPTDADLFPTGEVLAVEGTPMDFRTPKTIGTDIGSDYIQIVQGKGFDHNWCLNHAPGVCGLAASAIMRPAAGPWMFIQTFPASSFIPATGWAGKRERTALPMRTGTRSVLRPRCIPIPLNHPQFPSPVVKAGTAHVTRTSYRFYIGK